MARLRAGWRLLVIAVATAVAFKMTLLGRLLTFRRRAAEARWRHRCFGAWGRIVVRVLNIDVTVVGSAPRPPFFLVSNHLSYLDIAILASLVDAVFVAKSEVRGWPVVGFLCKHMGTIFIDRTARRDIPRVIGRIEKALEVGEGVVLFPEGTSTSGASVAPFRPSLLAPAARGGLPVAAAALSYSTPSGTEPAHLAVCWWGDMTFSDHFLRLLSLPGLSARVAFGVESIQDDDRKRLAERLETAVRGLFIPVAGAVS
ncbi:MAG: 1-acyl-sn-glycerol-3-phosphate acyltransferase [bacterium]|nr:1-acyl-sn-glycerol-3-phosphate acyltransferase [bacterium]